MRATTIALCCLVLVLATAGVPADERAERRVEADDEVVREVVRMLEGSVADDVIMRWLDREGRSPASLTSNDLIALTRADASRELVDRLMEAPSPSAPGAARRPRVPPRPVPPPRKRRSAAPPPSARPPGPPGSVPPPPAPAETESVAPAPATTGGGVPVEFAVLYRPYRDPEADEEEQWHLFAYLDGRPLTWSDGKSWLSRSKRNRDLSVILTPGRHVVRLVQERHSRRGEGWRHEARACPDPLVFEVVPGDPRVEIELREPFGPGFGTKATFRWTLLDDGDVVNESALAGPPEKWTPLCEEIESNYAEGDKIPRRVQKQLARCVRWADLWDGVTDVPDRSTVRSRLERHGFRPVAASK